MTCQGTSTLEKRTRRYIEKARKLMQAGLPSHSFTKNHYEGKPEWVGSNWRNGKQDSRNCIQITFKCDSCGILASVIYNDHKMMPEVKWNEPDSRLLGWWSVWTSTECQEILLNSVHKT